jgi:uncharacterized membrane protein YkvA (DUF1232 family)
MTKKNAHVQRDPDLLARLVNDIVLSGRLLFDRRVSGTAKLIPLVLCLYLLSPLDLLPDVFLPFGLVDDIALFLVGLQLFIHSAPQDVRDEYRGKRQEPKPNIAPGTAADDGDLPVVIDGQYEVREDKVDESG